MRALPGIIVLVLALALPACGPSADLYAGVGAYARGDYATALIEFRSAADQGNSDAQHNLGVMYLNGEGVTQDYVEAAKWFHRAAEQGFGKSQHNLGLIYHNGQGVTQDYVQAHKWYSLAAERSSDRDLDWLVNARDDVEAKMSPAQIAEAQRLAREWKPK